MMVLSFQANAGWEGREGEGRGGKGRDKMFHVQLRVKS